MNRLVSFLILSYATCLRRVVMLHIWRPIIAIMQYFTHVFKRQREDAATSFKNYLPFNTQTLRRGVK